MPRKVLPEFRPRNLKQIKIKFSSQSITGTEEDVNFDIRMTGKVNLLLLLRVRARMLKLMLAKFGSEFDPKGKQRITSKSIDWKLLIRTFEVLHMHDEISEEIRSVIDLINSEEKRPLHKPEEPVKPKSLI